MTDVVEIIEYSLGNIEVRNGKNGMKLESLNDAQIDRIIQMAWEDRTTFEAIREQFGLKPGEVIKLMWKHLKPSSFKLWRERTNGRATKHLTKRSFKVGRFRCKSQRG